MWLWCGCPLQGRSQLSLQGLSGGLCWPYLMGLNMAFPKSWNLRTSFRCTPLGFTTWGGKGVLTPGKGGGNPWEMGWEETAWKQPIHTPQHSVAFQPPECIPSLLPAEPLSLFPFIFLLPFVP